MAQKLYALGYMPSLQGLHNNRLSGELPAEAITKLSLVHLKITGNLDLIITEAKARLEEALPNGADGGLQAPGSKLRSAPGTGLCTGCFLNDDLSVASVVSM